MPVRSGYGPCVSDGITAHAPLAAPPEVVVAVDPDEGLVGFANPPSAARLTPAIARGDGGRGSPAGGSSRSSEGCRRPDARSLSAPRGDAIGDRPRTRSRPPRAGRARRRTPAVPPTAGTSPARVPCA